MPTFTYLDNALNEYREWNAIEVQKQASGNVTSMKSSAPYDRLMSSLLKVSTEQYLELVQWVNINKDHAPAPVYWYLANLSFRANKPFGETAKWLVIGQNTGTYDTGRCKDKTSRGAYIQLVRLNRQLVMNMVKNPEGYYDGWGKALIWLKENNYNASPMWVCSHGMSAFKVDEETGEPAQVDDLVISEELTKPTMAELIRNSEHYLNEYKSGRKKMPGT